MSDTKRVNAIVGQSGGPTSAINATLSGVIRGVLNSGAIDRIYGAFNGIDGILSDRFCDLSELFSGKDCDIELLSKTPAAALGSCRIKLPEPGSPKADEIYPVIFEFFKKHSIKYFFYIGGNDSMDTVMKLSAVCGDYDPEIRFIGVPKTIDNDLCGTDHTPGYGSAAKFIAASISEIVRDCAVYTVRSVTLVEIMGRDAGWLTAAADYPNFVNGEGPDFVYFPEKPFEIEEFFADLEKAFARHPNVVVALSEGLRYSDGRYVGEGTQSGVTDIFGHKYLAGTAKALEFEVKNRFGCKTRSFELSLPQRCAGHIMSETDRLESIETGITAVRAAQQGSTGCIICCERQDDPYRLTYTAKDIRGIANKVRQLPDDYINSDNNGITEKCFRYIDPLVCGETVQEYSHGIPRHYIIKK